MWLSQTQNGHNMYTGKNPVHTFFFFFFTDGRWYMPQSQAETRRKWVWGVGSPALFFLLTFLSLTREARAAESASSAHSRAPHIHPTLSSSTSRLLNIVTTLLTASACLPSRASHICSIWGKVLRVVVATPTPFSECSQSHAPYEFPRHHLSAKPCFPEGATGF